MPQSKPSPKKSELSEFKNLTILEQLNEIFESTSQKWIKVSSILSKLDMPLIDQRQSTFSPESLLKLYLYKRIKGIAAHNVWLIKHLEKNELDAYDLGFTKDENNKLILPTKRAFNKFFQNKVNDDTKLQLEKLSKDILKIATKKGIVLDLELVKETIKGNKKKKTKEKHSMKPQNLSRN